MTKLPAMVASGEIEAPDILVGGTPCQAFSVAGLRLGLSDDRGRLTITFVELANAIDKKRQEQARNPAIVVWENVPGVLTDKNNAFGCFLGGLSGAGCELQPPGMRWGNAGYIVGPQRTIAWRVLDAQYFGVPQRRKRVFVVASAGAIDPGQVLFEQNSGTGDFAAGKKTGQEITGPLEARTKSGGLPGTDGACSEIVIPCWWDGGQISQTLDAVLHKGQTMPEKNRFPAVLSIHDKETRNQGKTGIGSGNGLGVSNAGEPMFTLTTGDRHSVLTCHGTQDPITQKNMAFPLGRNHGQENVIMENLRVRRITPVEAERLQGFPDNHTRIPYRNKTPDNCPDGPRYKALGNSMAVPVMRFIGEGIKNPRHLISDER